MAFNRLALVRVLAVMPFVMLACGRSRNHNFVEFSGVPPEGLNSVGLLPDANTVIVGERQGSTLDQFTVNPFAFVNSMAMPFGRNNQLVLQNSNATYYLIVDGSHFAFATANGSSINLDPVSLPGVIQSAALAPTLNVAALFDDQQNAALFVLDGSGNVQASWITSTLVTNGEYVLSSAMLATGHLAVALSGTTIAVVDIAASVAAKAWKFTSLTVADAVDMRWIALLPGLGFNAVMLQDATRIVTVNVDSGALIDQKALGSAVILGRFRDAYPFVVSQPLAEYSAKKNDITFAGTGGKLTTITVQRATDALNNPGATDQLTDAWLDVSAGTVAFAYEPNASGGPGYSRANDDRLHPQWIERFHTSDGSAVDTSQIDDWVHLRLRSMYLVDVLPSALGAAEQRTYGSSPQINTLQGYNLKTATARY